MDNKHLKAWVLAVLADGVTVSEWVRASFDGKKRPNFLRGFINKPSAGLKHENVLALQEGLKKLNRAHLLSNQTAETPAKRTAPTSPSEEIQAFLNTVLPACACLSEEAKKRALETIPLIVLSLKPTPSAESPTEDAKRA